MLVGESDWFPLPSSILGIGLIMGSHFTLLRDKYIHNPNDKIKDSYKKALPTKLQKSRVNYEIQLKFIFNFFINYITTDEA